MLKEMESGYTMFNAIFGVKRSIFNCPHHLLALLPKNGYFYPPHKN